MQVHRHEIWLYNSLLDGYSGPAISEQEVAAEVARLQQMEGKEAHYRVEVRKHGVVAILEIRPPDGFTPRE